MSDPNEPIQTNQPASQSNATTSRKWYKKKRYFIPLGTVGLIIIAALNSGPAPTTTQLIQPTPQVKSESTSPEQIAPSAPIPSVLTPDSEQVSKLTPAPKITPVPAPKGCPTAAPNGYYTNIDGDCVPSPYKAPMAPAGATAQCRDGSYSFSQNHSGTCSHHGGVAQWLD